MKKIITLIAITCLLFSTVSTTAYAEEDTGISTGYINTINAKTGKTASYQGISKNEVIYMLPNDIATICEYRCESLSMEKEKTESIVNKDSLLSKLYSKINLDKLFKNDKFEYLVFSRTDTITDYITQIYYYDGYAQTMSKSFEIDTIDYDGKTYLNLEKMLYLMHAQWCVEESFLYYYPLDYNIFDFIGENFSYMYDHSVQHNSLLYEDENKWGHSTRIVLSHILNDIDMRIFIPFYGSDMIQQEWYEEAILQLATTDDSFIDDAGSKQISEYLKDSPYHKIETNLSAINIGFDAIDKIEDIPLKLPTTGSVKFSQWNDLSTLDASQLSATQNGLNKISKGFDNTADILSIINIMSDFNEINTWSKEWGNDFINGLNILSAINEDIYRDYGKDILKVADDLLDEFKNPTEEAAEAAMFDSYELILDKLLDKTIIGHIESIITLSNVIIKSNPNYAEQIENADLMNTVHALINVENVFLNEFVDSYHDYLHYLSIEDGSSSLRLWELMYYAVNEKPQRVVETKAISDMRNALEMFLKTSLRNKTYVYHFSYFNKGGSLWTPTSEAKALKDDIYKTYALLSELISTRDYDKLLYLDETFKGMYSNEYGFEREKIDRDILTDKALIDLKNLVTDAYTYSTTDEYGNEYHYKIPKINLGYENIINVNEEIFNKYYAIANEQVSFEVDYEWMVNKEVLSLIVHDSWDGGNIHYKIYNLSILTGERIADNEIIAKKMTKSEYLTNTKKALCSTFWNEYNDAISQFEDTGLLSFANEQLQKTIAKENIKDCTPYLGKNGNLYIRGRIFALAGADSYEHLIDLNDYEIPSNYAETIEIPTKSKNEQPETGNNNSKGTYVGNQTSDQLRKSIIGSWGALGSMLPEYNFIDSENCSGEWPWQSSGTYSISDNKTLTISWSGKSESDEYIWSNESWDEFYSHHKHGTNFWYMTDDGILMLNGKEKYRDGVDNFNYNSDGDLMEIISGTWIRDRDAGEEYQINSDGTWVENTIIISGEKVISRTKLDNGKVEIIDDATANLWQEVKSLNQIPGVSELIYDSKNDKISVGGEHNNYSRAY